MRALALIKKVNEESARERYKSDDDKRYKTQNVERNCGLDKA